MRQPSQNQTRDFVTEEDVLILTEDMVAAAPAPSPLPPPLPSEACPSPNDDAAAPDAADETPIDENLMALAAAESEIAAAETSHGSDTELTYPALGPRALAARKKRGSVIWGAIALGLAAYAWIFPFLAGFLTQWRRAATADWAPAMEGALLLGALIFGTIGCRRVAGKKMAIVGRIMAWTTPTLALLLDALFDRAGISLLPAVVALGLWSAVGFFIFAIIDAMVEP